MRILLSLFLTALWLHVSTAAPAQDDAVRHYLLSSDPTTAWAEVEKMHAALRPPEAWRRQKPSAEEVAEFQRKVREVAISFAKKAREFLERFPTNENAGDARITVVYALNRAVAAGDLDAEREVQKFVAAVLADQNIPEDDRLGVLLVSGDTGLSKRLGMRLFTEESGKLSEDYEQAFIASLHAALMRFPTNGQVYAMLVGVAERSQPERQRELVEEVLKAPNALPEVKTLARHILNGTKPYEVGQPLNIRFTALDGREVDLASLKGKVVLVEFWATTCGGCVVEMPAVKEAFEKFHGKGFEVVAISLDDKESALRRFIKEKALPWPQHFDGKGWANKFAVQFGIFSIPTMWLVDMRGNLRFTEADRNLAGQIEYLLKEPTPSASK